MKTKRKHVIETAHFLSQYITTPPLIGFLTGTGLSDSLNDLDPIAAFDYSKIPNSRVSTVKSQKGNLIYGPLGGKPLLMMQGRFHLYEGYSPQEVASPIRVMQELGVKTLSLSNAAGGVNLNFSAGDIMIIKDHINLTGKNPLIGPNEDDWGIRFPDMTGVYDPPLAGLAEEIALHHKIPVRTGVYAGLNGPSLETPAETRYLKIIGSDAVGFSTIMEAIAGVHAGMKILGISLITNINDPDAPQKTTLESVLKTAKTALDPLNKLLTDIIRGIKD